MITKPRGTVDILPSETAVWQYVEAAIRKQAAVYGFEEIRLPTFEVTELFSRGVGGTTDIVQKEMYTFTDKDGRSLSLRPEGTAGVARSAIENGLLGGAMPLKMYYLSNFFRYEKPQAGRTREFFQFGTELYGSDNPQGDATVIMLADSVLKALGVKSCRLHINSIGCPECRPAFRQALIDYFTGYKDELCPTCQSRLESNPLRILDCKSPVCSKIAEGAPKTLEYLCDDCKNRFETLKTLLSASGIDCEVDTGIVRGLDYYTGTVFEFIQTGIGAQSTVCGGGRYNGLVSELGGQPTPAVGFGMGISRLILAMKSENAIPEFSNAPDIYIAPLGPGAKAFAFAFTEKLRSMGLKADTDIMDRSLKAQMKYADKQGAANVVVVGDNEIASGVCTLQNMKNGEKTAVRLDAAEIYSKLTDGRI